jgi:hypothetical protein
MIDRRSEVRNRTAPRIRRKVAMQFVLLIYQGTTPTPTSEAWKAFSDEEKKQIYADYEALNKTPGISAQPDSD